MRTESGLCVTIVLSRHLGVGFLYLCFMKINLIFLICCLIHLNVLAQDTLLPVVILDDVIISEEKNGFSVVRDLVGHGIGKNLHEEPQVPNYGPPKQGHEIKEGMCLAIEPMINLGNKEVKTDDDGWTIRTLDGTFSAHFEHTIAVTASGPLVLSKAKA